jgi:hypothetical protein
MIYPTDEQLLGGIAKALKDTVLPDLARGSAARKQLQAAIETLRRMAFAAPDRDAVLAADNADMAEVLRVVGEIMAEAEHFTPTSPPPSRGRDMNQDALPLDGGGLGGGDAAATNQALQLKLIALQAGIPPALAPQITPLLTQLYSRMTDRALALMPPPMPRTPRTLA